MSNKYVILAFRLSGGVSCLHIKGLRISVIILTACLALGILTGGMWAYRKYSIQRPFIEKISNLPNVTRVEFKADTTDPLLKVELGSMGDLAFSISQLKQIVKNDFKGKVELHIVDQRDEILSESMFYIYEALANGNYIQMYSNVGKLIDNFGVDQWKIKMDNQYIYLEIFKGSNYLYEVIPRNQQLLVIGGDENYASD